jgi:hypothetical protein
MEGNMETLSKDPNIQESFDEKTILVEPTAETQQVVIDTTPKSEFSRLEGNKLHFKDIYQDARTLAQKTNSTKFIVTAYSMLTATALLMLNFISPDIYENMTLILTLSYLGADVVEKGVLLTKSKSKKV